MLGLSAVVAIAASGAAIFVVVSVVSIVVWVRYRKERHALALLGFKRGEYAKGLQSFPVDTLTELSQAEGSVLRTHGQLPYGRPGEWGQLTSRESLLRPKNSSESLFPLTEKARSLRHSLSRSRSKRLSKSSHKRMSSLATLDESSLPSPPPNASISKEDFPLSAVEGVLELPAERTPKQTPDPNEDDTGFHLGMRPVSPGWPFPWPKERSGLFPVIEGHDSPHGYDPLPMIFDESPQRLRGGSITSQTAGMVPHHSIPPPPPTAYPPDRFSYARNDSVSRMSNMSLDTTNSSILDDGRNGPRSTDTDLTSPIFPSGGTFVPFSAADVGVKDGRRSFIATNTSIPPMHNFPVRSSSTTETRHKSASTSPRRSMTTIRYSDASGSRFSGPPRRTDSLSSSNPPSRHASLRSGTPVGNSGYHNSSNSWRFSGSQMAFVPHFSQFQKTPIYDQDQMENDPFYVGSLDGGTLFHPVGSPTNSAKNHPPPSPMQRSSLSLKSPLPSALKGGNSQRKGHRRQNCVRISIHPPLTFGSSTFAPTVEEEPEDFDRLEELDLRESTINSPTKPLPSLPPSSMSSPSGSRRSKYGSRRGKPALGSLGPLAEEPQLTSINPNVGNNPDSKRKHGPFLSTGDKHLGQNDRALPELFTSISPSDGICLSHTPSPERVPPIWEVPEVSSPSHENSSPGTGSPRRSAVKGPRHQPQARVTAARSQSTRVSSRSSDHMASSPLDSPSRLPLVMSITGTEGSDWRRSTDSLHRTRTDAADRTYRRNRDSIGSMEGGLGPIGCSSPIYGTRRPTLVKDRVHIFEDVNRTESPYKSPFKSTDAQPIGTLTTPESSPTRNKNSIPRSMPNYQQYHPSGAPDQRVPPTPTSARRDMATPTGKGLGLGIGTATPGSLYDGDGFLRE
ncbi:hypothetical protein PENANT_c004G08315 [Penicillium antarcticum]|uniref:Uncharacterized protein n=1 Tax=Penicillium antarcticum TaxID=416450 RepID=A0A1V6QGT2_9EURO|nr:uncharacterized protein N7508_002304 [Penicillium antarcticum]KAJ5317796.1 hypothetical protein N7508_002304 [Penicillium antarcticum]OQD88423.1 hypothetical protein PENANT_c004G08315 [Penicillium antarcticum]